MKKETPPYVVRLRGTLYFKRRGWTTRRFVAQELGPDFYAEYTTILNGVAPQPKAFMVSGLISAYYKSNKYQALKPRTQADYQKHLRRFKGNAADVMVRSIKTKHVIAWRDQLVKSDGAHYANYFVRVLRILFKFAGQIGEIDGGFNPATGVEAVRYAKRTPKPWTPELIQAARDSRPYSDKTRLLFELLYCTGQRIGDVLCMKWSDIHGDAIDVSQNKTAAALTIPMHHDLKECLKRADRLGETILTAHGKDTPYAYRSAAQAMQKLRGEIGAEEHTIHDIRHTVASEIGADGDDSDVMSITGHTTSAMVQHYAGAARQKARAAKVQKRRE